MPSDVQEWRMMMNLLLAVTGLVLWCFCRKGRE